MKQSLNQHLDERKQAADLSKHQLTAGDTSSQLWETLNTDKYPKLILSQPDENSPKIRTYAQNNSPFADKGTCSTEITGTCSVQDLVLLTTDYYCSPDWRSYSKKILNIDLFPKESDLPDEYNNTRSDKYWSGKYDYLAYDKENDQVFRYWEWNQLSRKQNYFRVSPDDTVLLPDIETVEPCNGWYFHHIVIDNKCWYKTVDGKNIQEVVNALIDQKREKERIAEYRKKNWDIGIELPFTEYYRWWYETRVYMWDHHWTPAHEHSDERRTTSKILVKHGNPWDHINFYNGARYTLYIDGNKHIRISLNTDHRWNNQQDWWYKELNESTIQKWQIFVNGQDVYESTVSRIAEYSKEQKEKRNTKFNELKEFFVNEAGFSENEFNELTKYPRKWERLSFLEWIRWLLSEDDNPNISSIKDQNITKDEILETTRETLAFHMNYAELVNYILIKRKAGSIDYDTAKRVKDKAYAFAYLSDSLPWIPFSMVGKFDDAIVALSIALKTWLFRKMTILHSNKDLWIKLQEALEKKKNSEK